MGELYLHDLQHYIEKYGCNVFVETGTGKGTGLFYAMKFPFKKMYSIEINKELYAQVRGAILTDHRVTLLNLDSIRGLEFVLDMTPPEDRILFWLDAHFPGADFQLGSYDDVHPDYIKYPLAAEVYRIFMARPKNRDVFIIDDLQLYEDGDYELKLNPVFVRKHRRDLTPVLRLAEKTHNIRRDYRHQGFLIAEPE